MKKNQFPRPSFYLAIIFAVAALFFILRNVGKNQGLKPSAVKKAKVVIVPKKLQTTCEENYFTENATSCANYQIEPTCFYYTKKSKTIIKKQAAQFNNVCFGCYFFGKNGSRTIAQEEFTKLGYEKKPCKEEIFDEQYAK